MAIFDQDYRPPTPTEGDSAHALAKAGLGMLPLIGAPAQELLGRIVAPPLERRRQEWMEEVGEALRRLESEKGVRLEALGDNPAFVDAVAQATAAAIKTSQTTKREALRNAVLNSASPQAPEASVQALFIGLVETFTEWHLRILKLFQDPSGVRSNSMAPAGIIENGLPELRGRRDIYDLVWSELHARGLVSLSHLHVNMSAPATKRTTPLGDQFLAFIGSPL